MVVGYTALSAFIKAYPYSVPSWLPPVFTSMVDGISFLKGNIKTKLSTLVSETTASFFKTHGPEFSMHKSLFTEDQLAILHNDISGVDYFA